MHARNPSTPPGETGRPRDAPSLSRPRLLTSLTLGATVIVWIYSGPPVDRLAGVDLRFGLTGPLSGDPWKWLGAAALMAVVLCVERLGPYSLMIHRPSGRDLEWVLYAFGIVMAWSWVAGRLAPQDDNEGITTIVNIGVAGVIILIVTAAVTEEVAYRGFLAERLGALFGRRPWARPLGATMSLVVFLLPHIAYFGPSWLLHQMPGALAIAGIALLRRNLVAAMLLHLLINLPILIPTALSAAGP